MARDTLMVQFQLEASYPTIQAIRQALADQTTQAQFVSRLSEIATDYLASHSNGEFDLKLVLKVAPVPKTRRGPRQSIPKIEQNVLKWYDPDAGLTNTVGPVGSSEWLAWLDNDWARSFRYESTLGSFTAIKEQRRGRPVWYAHRRRAGQLKRLYLGKTENLTATKLAEVARRLNSP